MLFQNRRSRGGLRLLTADLMPFWWWTCMGPQREVGSIRKVYIVSKGAPVYAKPGSEVFSSDPTTKGDLVWKREHLLEIHYDIAEIHKFRNLWGCA